MGRRWTVSLERLWKNASSSRYRCYCSHASYLARLPLPSPRTQQVLSILSASPERRIQALDSLKHSSHFSGDFVYDVLRYITEWQTALQFYTWGVNQPSYRSNVRAVKRTLSILCAARRFGEAHELFQQAVKSGIKPDGYMYSSILCSLADGGRVQDVFELLEQMKMLNIQPVSKMVNIMLTSLKADDGVWVLRNFYEMVNCVSCNIVMDKLSKQTRIEEAYQLLLEMQGRGMVTDGFPYTTLIHGYCQLGKIEQACKVLEGMKASPTTATYNAIIQPLCRLKRFEDAFMLVDDMVEKGCLPTVVTFSILVDGLCKAGKLNDACKLLEDMVERGCTPNTIVFNALIDGLCKEGRCEEAHELIDSMSVLGCVPTKVTFNTLIDGFCKVDEFEKGYELLKEMVRRGYEPNVVTYNTFLHSFCKTGKVDEARKLFQEMIELKLHPDAHGYTTLIDGLCHAGKVDEAYSVLEEMQAGGGVTRAVACYNALIAWLCKVNEMAKAQRLFERMRSAGVIPNSLTFGMLIFGYCRAYRIDDALGVLELMKSYECEASSAMYSTLIDALNRRERVDEAHRLLHEMIDKGLSPTYTTFHVLKKQWKDDSDPLSLELEYRNERQLFEK